MNGETCHGCSKPQQGGIVTLCVSCGTWGVFCAVCLGRFQDGSCAALTQRGLGKASSPDGDYFSASQLEAFQDCPRKWGWKYLDGIEAPPNPYAAFGLRLHRQIELYLTKGTPFDLTTDAGEAAMAGLHYLPKPGTPGLTVEGKFILDGWGHRFLGYKDIQIIQPGLVPKVADHKSTGNFKWAKTPDELKTNIQAVLYATDVMVKTGSQDCDLLWIYYKRTKPFAAKPVTVRVNRTELEPTLVQIKDLADGMATIKASRASAIDLPTNLEACGKYGGCPYVNRCNLSPQEKLIAIMTTQSLEDRKNAFLAGIRQNPQPGAGADVNPPQQGFQPQGQFQQTPAQQGFQQGPPQQGFQPQGQFQQAPTQFQPPPQQGFAQGQVQPQGQQGFQPQAPTQQGFPIQGPPQGQFQPPPQQNQAPAQFQPPPQEDPIVAQARMSHPNWNPGEQWWNGQGFVQPGQPGYPPVNPPQQAQPSQGAPQEQSQEQSQEQGGKRGGRPKKNAEGVALATEGMAQIATGFSLLVQALKKGVLD